MTFHILTIFPELFEPYLSESIIGRGIQSGKIKTKIYDLRRFTLSKHYKVDGKAYGGGPGMVLGVEPLSRALSQILKGKSKRKTLVVLTDPSGKSFSNQLAAAWAKKYEHIVVVAGRYEGFDQRIKSVVKNGMGFAVQEISVGPFVVTGGEIPALLMIDATARQIPGVLGKNESLEEARYGVGVSAYTRPEIFKFKGKTYKVPAVLLSGDHGKIDKWRKGRGNK
ncbi:MAG: tRNA (guanine-N(1)-)-methyltransferase [Parcubacteria group bacterium GW2011_GWA1_47_11]|uniref:tRNA (guanine-N(1)-)-methyltransferase n=1 Tax=Candidatus Colwellbacteria bacterium GWA2_46_10 TaxID=1797684 RepID=A0A1G1YW55_9BACT|nr:MAG: tRNA (guanine-N(1)-)-methyltransferase [Parcubacteria group bacterium GW2011_GWA2_46_10]KKU56167.1 MAG: tRNA (guanine-N(1)-)-methyltransferase [Parcubacteria group bacterium GW2011_GWA1_47_11]OGY56554.1 MAG: hypothetical protein A2119_01445 [Candidatus Colwellbacteria bacterium GWA2_46_10]